MEDLSRIKNIVVLNSRLQNLCEGFDETSKTALITSKLKILLELSICQKVSPSVLKMKVGLAKSNLAIICAELQKNNYIIKLKDDFDSRIVFYAITEKGKQFLNENLAIMKKNFEGELAYKNNFKQIDSSIEELYELVK